MLLIRLTRIRLCDDRQCCDGQNNLNYTTFMAFMLVGWVSACFSVWVWVYLCSAMHDAVPIMADTHTQTHRPPMDSQTEYHFLFTGYWAYFTCSYLPQPAPHHKRGPVPIQQLTRTTNWWIHCPWSSAPVTKLIVAVNQHNCSFPLPTNPVQPHPARGYFLR